MMNTLLISEDQSKDLLQFLLTDPLKWEYAQDKNQLVFDQEGSKTLTFRLPISIASPQTFIENPEDRANYVLLMMRSGIASIGYFEDGENIDHKVFRAYMVRKKQGMSQLKYLKTKGKSRAGSRVRLAETAEFFEQINERLNDYFSEYHVGRIGLSCPVTLIPYLYGSKVPSPFGKDDPRLFKIPKHVQKPTFESLMAINQYLLKGEIKYKEEGKEVLEMLLAALAREKKQSPPEDDW